MSRQKTMPKIKTPTIIDLLTCSTREVFDYIEGTLDIQGIPYTYNKDYIVTDIENENQLPLICAHVDTVNDRRLTKRKAPLSSHIHLEKNTLSLSPLSSADCLGADDRAGIWIALQLINSHKTNKTQFNFAFFDKEESGAIGSSAFARKYPDAQYSCFIGLDRANRGGKQNCATYDYDNKELIKLFTDQGYQQSSGTFSDCSNLSNYYEKPCVNLSVGYQNEHSTRETLNILSMAKTLEVMQNIHIPSKEYPIEERNNLLFHNYDWRYDYKPAKTKTVDIRDLSNYEPLTCHYCDRHNLLYETEEGYFVCADCLEYHQNWINS